MNSLLRHMSDIAPPPFCEATQLLVPADTITEAICSACHHILHQPLELACGHHICCGCLQTQLQETHQLQCPECRADHPIDLASVCPPPSVLVSLLPQLPVNCPSCNGRVRAENFDEHHRSGCKVHLSIEVSSFLQPLTTPTTDLERNVASNVVRRMMHERGDNSVVVSTGGKVCIQIDHEHVHINYY